MAFSPTRARALGVGWEKKHDRDVLEVNVDMADQATVDHQFFARFYRFMSRRESESLRAWRQENLADLSGRVLEIGAGTGTNFALYPSTVTEVIAIEPERRLTEIAREAAKSAPVPVTVADRTIERFDPSLDSILVRGL